MYEAARAQKPVGSESPSGGSSDGTKVSHSAARVRRCGSVNRSLVTSAPSVSEICWVTMAEYGGMCGSRGGAYPGGTISDWRFVYLRMPSGPWRGARPDPFQPPLGRAGGAHLTPPAVTPPTPAPTRPA